jgi:hypothetical protein
MQSILFFLKDFARLPWQNQSSQGPVAPVGPATPPGVSLGPGAGSGPYAASSRPMPGTGSTFGSTGGASAGGLGSLTQPDVTLDEVDHTTSTLRLSNSTSMPKITSSFETFLLDPSFIFMLYRRSTIMMDLSS